MARVVNAQSDMFSPVQAELFGAARGASQADASDPLEELRALVMLVQGAERLPWDGVCATMEQERRALGLARAAGPEGEVLLSAMFAETERLLATTD